MLTAPIPRFLLPHECVLRVRTSVDEWGKAVYEDKKICHVRIEPCYSRVFSLGGDTPQVCAKMFFDCFNSFPVDTIFSTGDIIVFMGKEYVISKVETYYAQGMSVHHYEVLLT